MCRFAALECEHEILGPLHMGSRDCLHRLILLHPYADRCEVVVMGVGRSNRKRGILRQKQGGLCCYCGCKMTPVVTPRKGKVTPPTSETIEHIQRKQDGGTNRIGNLALACFECNFQRGSMDWLTYKSWRMGELSEFIS